MLPKDPYILVSYINTLLRDKYSNLEAMRDDLGEEVETAVSALSDVGYVYDVENNCFQAK